MTFKHHKSKIWSLALSTLLLSSCGANNKDGDEDKSSVQIVPVVKVERRMLDRELTLPGEMLAYQDVPIHAKVEGFIEWIGVDRGSIVKKGQKMITIFCPELNEKTKEGAAKLSSARASYKQAQANEDSQKSRLVEANARFAADSLTYSRLKEAAKTPGAVAQNEVDLQEKSVESDQARVSAVGQEVAAAHNVVLAELKNVQAALDVLNSLKDMLAYLTITAPFDGVITERNVHVGSIVAVDPARSALPLIRIQEKDILRLVVAVPEDCVSGIHIGDKFPFTVPAFVGKTFYGFVARPAYALNNSTRTMPVELNYFNTDGTMEPGMFASVRWIIKRPYDTLFVPSTAVESDLRGTFAIRVDNDLTKRVTVQRGLNMNNYVEVTGDIHEGDLVALKATDELKDGTRVDAKMANAADIATVTNGSSGGGASGE